MFLKGVEISGFKSFCDRVYIEFGRGITSVVGPNGSGKSNIMDAVLWVLGEQSYKNIRAKESSDVIFSGSGKTADSAKVSLYIDNRDNFLVDMGEEVKITRKLNKKGENEYLINDKRARLKDIGTLFLDTGVGKSAYSVIGQGKVERIISSSNKEIKQIIEEAAGIKKFQLSRNDSLKNLHSLSEELEKILLVKNEVEKNRNHIEKQASKAKEYLVLKSEKESLEKSILTYDLDIKGEGYSQKSAAKEELSREIDKLNGKISENEDEFNRNELERESINLKIQEYRAINGELKEKIEEEKRELTRVEERKEAFIREREGMIEERERVVEKLNLQKEYIESINSNYKNILDSLVELESENVKFESQIKREEDEKRLFEVQLEIKKRKLMELEVERLRVNSDIESSERRIKNSQNKLESLEEEIKKARNLEESLRVELGSLEIKQKRDEESLKNVEKRVTELEGESTAVSSENNRLTGIIRNKEYEEKRATARLSSLIAIEESNEGLFKGVKEVLNAKLDGVHGIVASIISIPEGLEKAIEAAIPGNLQDIVVESSNVAKRGVEILKEKKVGRASFLALDTIKVVQNRREYKSGNGVVGLASTLISSEERYKKVVDFLLGNLLIVEDIETGLKILKQESHSGNVVTLSGELLSARGRITGGESQNSTLATILERKREKKSLETTLNNLQQELKVLNGELDGVRIKLEKLEDEIMNIDTLIESAKKEYRNSSEELNEKKSALARAGRDLQILIGEESEERTYIEEFKRRALSSADEKVSKEEEIEKINSELVSINENINSLGEKIKELGVTFSDIRIKYLNSKDRKIALELERERESKEFEDIQNDIKNRDEKIGEYAAAIDKALIKVQELKDSIKRLNEKFISENSEIQKMSQEITTLSEREKTLITERRELDIVLLKSNESFGKLIEECEKLQGELSRISIELESLSEVVSETALRSDTIGESRVKFKTVESKFRNFETVNLLAIEEFIELDNKFNNLVRQYVDIDESRKRLLEVIESISSEIELRFNEAYTSINSNFNELCMDILHNSEGKLLLTEGANLEESGVDIVVKYKNKRQQSLSLFSGGEKSMVAIAFVLAIFMYKPSPFTFLDEIEAALDDKNTRKLIGKLKEFTDRSQFILITHNKETMRESDTIFGVTMNKEVGISKIVPVKF